MFYSDVLEAFDCFPYFAHIPYDVKDEDGKTVISIEVPGLGPDSVSVKVVDSKIGVTVTRKGEKHKIYFRLRSYDDVSSIESVLSKGVLKISIPTKPENREKVIPIRELP